VQTKNQVAILKRKKDIKCNNMNRSTNLVKIAIVTLHPGCLDFYDILMSFLHIQYNNQVAIFEEKSNCLADQDRKSKFLYLIITT